AVEWSLGCRLDVALKDVHIPNLRSRGVSAITPIQLDSLVIMRSAVRLYLGEVVGIYRYGSVSGRHEGFVTAETVDGLSYLSLRVYEQLHPGYNMFQHIVPPERPRRDALALFTHAPVSELIYLLSGAKMSKKEEEEEEEEDEEDYEEPEGTSSKKRKPKPPRGASKKQKEAAAEKQKVQRKKKEDGRRKSDREGSGSGGEGSQREEIVDSTPLERENAPAAGKKTTFLNIPLRK
ncbi:hypothetical protein B0H14DRAFT_3655709, partial [Mycena olivaceomarginata]